MTYREVMYRRWLKSRQDCRSDFRNFARKGVILKTDGKVWRGRYLEKANHNLDFANLVAELHKNTIKERFPQQTFYDWAAIAYYYAIYHAALALLANAGFKSRSHLATLCGIIGHYYHKDRGLEKRHVEILSRIEEANIEQFAEVQGLRERASYGVSIHFEERLAAIAKADAVEFVNKVKEILT